MSFVNCDLSYYQNLPIEQQNRTLGNQILLHLDDCKDKSKAKELGQYALEIGGCPIFLLDHEPSREIKFKAKQFTKQHLMKTGPGERIRDSQR